MKKDSKAKIIAMIPTGEQKNFSAFYADGFNHLLDNGKLHLSGTDGVDLTVDMVDKMQSDINVALEKLNDYTKELELAQYFLNNIKESKVKTKEKSVKKLKNK